MEQMLHDCARTTEIIRRTIPTVPRELFTLAFEALSG